MTLHWYYGQICVHFTIHYVCRCQCEADQPIELSRHVSLQLGCVECDVLSLAHTTQLVRTEATTTSAELLDAGAQFGGYGLQVPGVRLTPSNH